MTKHSDPTELCKEAFKIAMRAFWLALVAVVLAIAGVYPHAAPTLQHVTEGVANATGLHASHSTTP